MGSSSYQQLLARDRGAAGSSPHRDEAEHALGRRVLAAALGVAVREAGITWMGGQAPPNKGKAVASAIDDKFKQLIAASKSKS